MNETIKLNEKHLYENMFIAKSKEKKNLKK